MKPTEPRVAGSAGRGGTGNLLQEPYTAPPPAPQQPQPLGGVTRRIIERLDQQRAWPKPKGGPSDGAQRKAAFHDPRQLRLPISRPNTKDNSHEKA